MNSNLYIFYKFVGFFYKEFTEKVDVNQVLSDPLVVGIGRFNYVEVDGFKLLTVTALYHPNYGNFGIIEWVKMIASKELDITDPTTAIVFLSLNDYTLQMWFTDWIK